MSRTKNSLKNVKFALIFQAASILVAFLTRKVFVMTLSKEYLGLDGTFANILTMLSLAELGAGSAITFSLYKPLAEDDRGQVTALMALYRKVYWAIGIVVAVLGCTLVPFLSVLIHDLPDIPYIRVIYLLFVLNTVLSYFYVYKQSLIMADQKQYIVTYYRYGLKMLMLLAQAAFLWVTRNYFVYLGLQIGTTLLENLLLSRKANQLYPYLHTTQAEPIRPEVKDKILKNIRALMVHKLGGAVVFGTDNLLISFFEGVVAVGLYSNYLLVTNGLKSVYSLVYRSLTASVGHLAATENPDHAVRVFYRVDFFGRWLYGFSAICLMILFNPFIALWVGEDYLFSPWIVLLIVMNFYVTGMRQATLTFRDAYGLYWYDRHKPIFESIINLVVSVALAKPLGVAGIFIGTFISTMTTCFWIEPLVLFRHGFHVSVKPYFRNYLISTVLTMAAGVVTWKVCGLLPSVGLLAFCGKVLICALLPNALFALCYCGREEFWYFLSLGKKLLMRS